MTETLPRIINDEVWGPTKISEPVLLEIIDSKEMQRTNGISQLGPPQEYHHLTTFSRGSHNIGTMLAVRKVGGSLGEQVPAATHDLSHSACSHIIDWTLGSNDQDNHQDNIHREHLLKTDIPIILARHGFNFDQIVDHHNFPLLEQPSPRLCADRVDYGLREMKVSGLAPEFVQACVDSLIVAFGRMVFDNYAAAHHFGWEFLKLYQQDWGSRRSVVKFRALASILQESLSRRVIGLEDFYQDDQYLFDKLKNSGEQDLIDRLESMKGRESEMIAANGIKGELVHSKFRYTDPEFMFQHELVKLSEMETEFKFAIEAERLTNQKGIII